MVDGNANYSKIFWKFRIGLLVLIIITMEMYLTHKCDIVQLDMMVINVFISFNLHKIIFYSLWHVK